jgi:hypothetical protein
MLSSHDIGERGRVTESGKAGSMGTFLVQMDYDPLGRLTIIHPTLDIYLDAASYKVPDWAPPLSIDDALGLHETAIEALNSQAVVGYRSADELAEGQATAVWWRRLPIDADTIWPMLQAHGAAPRVRKEFRHLFSFGHRLLVRNHGRKPVRRKQMKPFEVGRYMTEKDRELWKRLRWA